LGNIGSLINKEFGRLKTDKRTLFLIFVIPIILIVIFGLTSGGGPQLSFTVAVITQDEMTQTDFQNQTAKYDDRFISVVEGNCTSFTLYRYFNATTETEYDSSLQQAKSLIRNEIIDAVIILPANFSECVQNFTDPTISYIGDGTDVNVIDGFETALTEPITWFKVYTGTFTNFTVAYPNLEYDVPFWKSQVLNYALAIIIPLVILGTTMNLTSLCIVTETPLPRLVLTPSGKKDFILSKFIAYSIVMLIQVTEIFTLVNFFGLYCRGPLISLYIALIIVGLCGITMGMAVSAVANTSQQANQMFIMLFIMLTLFSNAFLPVTLLPQWMQNLANIFPLTHAIPLLRDITMRGITIPDKYLGVLLGLSAIYLIVAYLAFARKKIEV